jgi:molybdate transport system substrate-binding protein
MRKLPVILFCAAIAMAPGTRAAELRVAAAASLTDVLRQIGSDYERSTGQRPLFNFASSSTLARQIEEEAPLDLFISADEAQMDRLEKAGLIKPKSRRDLLSNTLAIIVSSDTVLPIHGPRDLAERRIRRIAMADPRSVPAGVYAMKYLQGLGLWKQVAPKVIPTDNVRGALAAVEAGNVDAAIVYRTDALSSKSVRIIYVVPPSEGPPIRYPAAMISATKNGAEATRFLHYLSGPAAQSRFAAAGFILLH